MFGNLALDQVLQRIEEAGDDLKSGHTAVVASCDVYANTLAEIGTAQAARVLIRCYKIWVNPEDQQTISVALARMLNNELVASELMEIQYGDLPRPPFSTTVVNDPAGWAYETNTTTAFLALDRKVRTDLTAKMKETGGRVGRGVWSGVSFRVLFPAMIDFLRSKGSNLAQVDWQGLGFEFGPDLDGARLSHLSQDLRHSEVDLHSSLSKTRVIGIGASSGESGARKSWRQILEAYLVLFFLWNLSFLALFVYGFAVRMNSSTYRSRNLDVPLLVYSGLSCLALLSSVAYVKTRKRGSISATNWLDCFFRPLRNILRRAPYLTQLPPVLNLLLFELVFTGFSLFGAFIMIASFQGIKDIPASAIFIAPQVLFWVVSALYYKFFVMSLDSAAYLLALHPQGRAILGYTFE